MTRAPRAAFGAGLALAGAFVWLSPVPALPAVAMLAAGVLLAEFHFRNHGEHTDTVQVLRLEPLGRLSVLVGRRDGGGPRRLVKVRDFSVPRLLRGYAELLVELDGGRKTTIRIFPGVCSADAFRRLRKFLLSSKGVPAADKAGLARRLGGELARFLLRLRRRSSAPPAP